MDADGRNQTRLTNDSGVKFNPAWSRDGSQIAFHSDVNKSSKQIWVMSATGADQHAVLATAAEDANPTWAPDNYHLAFQSGVNDSADIYIVGVDGKGLSELTFGSGADTVPDWR
jgi:Tol biopolymer transport system component